MSKPASRDNHLFAVLLSASMREGVEWIKIPAKRNVSINRGIEQSPVQLSVPKTVFWVKSCTLANIIIFVSNRSYQKGGLKCNLKTIFPEQGYQEIFPYAGTLMTYKGCDHQAPLQTNGIFRVLAKETIDLMVSNGLMPDMDGLKFL